MSRPKREQLEEIRKRCNVSFFQPTGEAVQLAKNRTDGMRIYFMEEARRAPFYESMNSIESLAVSAYLQGIQDTVEVFARRGIELPLPSNG